MPRYAVATSDYRFEMTPTGLNVFKNIISVRGHFKPRKRHVVGILLRRRGMNDDTILAASANGGTGKHCLDYDDEMVVGEVYFHLVKHFGKELHLAMGSPYDTHRGVHRHKESKGH